MYFLIAGLADVFVFIAIEMQDISKKTHRTVKGHLDQSKRLETAEGSYKMDFDWRPNLLGHVVWIRP